jgi:hypothetical protein
MATTSRSKRFAEKSTRDDLAKKGVDVDFLIWLEGEDDRLPRLDALRKLTAEQLAAAIRAASWLREFEFNPSVVPEDERERWESRYRLLDVFLCQALRFSGNVFSEGSDMEILEEVLEELLPKSSWERYRRDILTLRNQGQPLDLSAYGKDRRPSGGSPEKEQTHRMRAAIAHLRNFSDRPYKDLVDLWNEVRPTQTYDDTTIVQRLRTKPGTKGQIRTSKETADGACSFWRELYLCKREGFLQAFPGPFPMSRELRERVAKSKEPQAGIRPKTVD